MNCLLLGAGYVGRHAIRRLEEEGVKTAIFSRTPKNNEWPYPGPFPDGFDTLLFTVAPDGPNLYEETYLKNAQILAKSSLKRIIYTSSTSVYGDHNGHTVDEETPVKALNDRTQILIETEETLLKSDKDVLIFRLGEITGPGRDVKERLKNRPILPGTGENRVNLSPLDLIIEGISFGFHQNLSGIYNLVADFHPTRKEFYESLVPNLTWDPNISSPHGGNKVVLSQKLKDKGFVTSLNPI